MRTVSMPVAIFHLRTSVVRSLTWPARQRDSASKQNRSKKIKGEALLRKSFPAYHRCRTPTNCVKDFLPKRKCERREDARSNKQTTRTRCGQVVAARGRTQDITAI